MSRSNSGLTEQQHGRAAMLVLSIIVVAEINTGSPLLNIFQKVDITSIWWALGVYS